jgi:hypothetical protein
MLKVSEVRTRARETAMSITTVKHLAVAAAIAGLAVPMTVATPAQASGGDFVRKSGTCTNGSTWKLKAKHDDGRIEWEFEVDTNRNGRVWAVKVTDNGRTVFSGNRTTRAPSGSFSVERRTANRAGVDAIRARATRGTAVCAGSLRV